MVLEFSAGDACSDCVIANSLLRVSFIIFGEATIATLETPNPRESKTAQTKINETYPPFRFPDCVSNVRGICELACNSNPVRGVTGVQDRASAFQGA